MQYKRLANTWPWNKEWIAIAFWLPGLTGLLLMFLTKATLGNYAYWFLGISFWGLLFACVYSYVANKVSFKMNQMKLNELDATDGLVSFGKVQAPSAIALTKDTLYLSPIVGPAMTFSLADLVAVSMQSELPGKKLLFKKAFVLKFKDEKTIAFAVKQIFAQEMREIFMAVLPEQPKP